MPLEQQITGRVPTYLPPSFNYMVFRALKIPVAYFDFSSGETIPFWDHRVQPKFCSLRMKIGDETCIKHRNKWIQGLKDRSSDLERVFHCDYGRLMRTFPVRDENENLIGAVVAGGICDERFEIEKAGFIEDDDTIMTEELFHKRTDEVKIFAEHVRSLYLMKDKWNIDILSQAGFKKDLSNRVNILQRRIRDKEHYASGFYQHILKLFSSIIPFELATFRFRHTDTDVNETIIEDYSVLKAVVADNPETRRYVEAMKEHYVLRLDDQRSMHRTCFEGGEVLLIEDFTHEEEFKWKELGEYLKARSLLLIPLKNSEGSVFAVMGFYCYKYDIFPSLGGLKSLLSDVADIISTEVERFVLLTLNKNRRKFRTKVASLIGKFEHEFYREVRYLLLDTLPENTKIDIWLFDKNENNLKIAGVPADQEKYLKPKKRNMSFPWRIFIENLDPDKPQAHIEYDYQSDSKRRDSGKILVATLGAQLRNLSSKDNEVVGVICCQQKLRSFDHFADASLDENRDYLAYMAFIFSLFIGNFEIINRAQTLMTVLGHEVVKPMSYVFENIQYLDWYKTKKDEEKYLKRYGDLTDNIHFAIYTTSNLKMVGVEPKLTEEYEANFFQDVLLPMVKYLKGYAIKDRGIDIVYDGSFPQRYLMDINAIRQAFFNLIMNAVKYSYRTGPNVIITGKKDVYYWEIAIRDFGIGIPPKEVGQIFKLMAYCSNTRKHDNTGIGIGCYIAKQIIRLHGGDIEVTNFKNPTEFIIKLPLSR